MDATFWATVALVLFFALIAYFKVPAMIGKALDGRSDKIRNDLLRHPAVDMVWMVPAKKKIVFKQF